MSQQTVYIAAAFDDGYEPISAEILGVHDTKHGALVCALKSLLSGIRHIAYDPKYRFYRDLDSSYPDERGWQDRWRYLGCDLRFEVQHWHVNGNSPSPPFRLCFDTFLKMKIVSEGLDHDSTKALLTRWTLSINQGLICEDLAPLFTFDDPRRNKRTPYPGDRAEWVEVHGSKMYWESSGSDDESG
jgi:hypothetical protein